MDDLCRKGCVQEDELVICEHLRERIIKAFPELAALLIICTKSAPDTKKTLRVLIDNGPVQSLNSPFGDDQWITFTKAAEILAVAKSTVFYWVSNGKLRDNELKGRRRRVLETDVILFKHLRDNKSLQDDADDLRKDARNIPFKH